MQVKEAFIIWGGYQAEKLSKYLEWLPHFLLCKGMVSKAANTHHCLRDKGIVLEASTWLCTPGRPLANHCLFFSKIVCQNCTRSVYTCSTLCMKHIHLEIRESGIFFLQPTKDNPANSCNKCNGKMTVRSELVSCSVIAHRNTLDRWARKLISKETYNTSKVKTEQWKLILK